MVSYKTMSFHKEKAEIKGTDEQRFILIGTEMSSKVFISKQCTSFTRD